MISSVKRIRPRLKPNDLIQFHSPVTSGSSVSLAGNKCNKHTKQKKKKIQFFFSLFSARTVSFYRIDSTFFWIHQEASRIIIQNQNHYSELEHSKLLSRMRVKVSLPVCTHWFASCFLKLEHVWPWKLLLKMVIGSCWFEFQMCPFFNFSKILINILLLKKQEKRKRKCVSPIHKS